MWTIKLIVQWNIHSFAPNFLGSATKINIPRSFCISLQSYILFIISLSCRCRNRLRLTAFLLPLQLVLLFIWFSTDLTSDFNISDSSISLCIVGFSKIFVSFLKYFSFSIMSVSNFILYYLSSYFFYFCIPTAYLWCSFFLSLHIFLWDI